ncbi:MAG: hypothetical protein JWO22_2139 [Frankiales bacterium]|nr:hypothetical protein [Frankiales bacterium]
MTALEDQDRTTKCEDCGASIAQPSTGRPRRYCDATCRKNAKRMRDYLAWKPTHEAWAAREAQRRRAFEQMQADWDAKPVPSMTSWEIEACAAMWTPPGGWARWDLHKKTEAYGSRTEWYVTDRSDPEPQSPGDYRQGARNTWW